MSEPLSKTRRALVAGGSMAVPAVWAIVWTSADLADRAVFVALAGLVAVGWAVAAGALTRLIPAVVGAAVLGAVAAAVRFDTDATTPGAVVGIMGLAVLLLAVVEVVDQVTRGGVQAGGRPLALPLLVPPLLVGGIGAVVVGAAGVVRFDGTAWAVLAGAAAIASLAWSVRELLQRAGRSGGR